MRQALLNRARLEVAETGYISDNTRARLTEAGVTGVEIEQYLSHTQEFIP